MPGGGHSHKYTSMKSSRGEGCQASLRASVLPGKPRKAARKRALGSALIEKLKARYNYNVLVKYSSTRQGTHISVPSFVRTIHAQNYSTVHSLLDIGSTKVSSEEC